ncbi:MULTISPECIES: hypothetical protein [Rhodococcus]|uniref:hypothetical protein n=1 Tax=Rhodococcus TaxID=1827 RepID=UPI001FD7EBAC|nr:hypothetical protein [Rhodococcus gordoniae]UTT48082.1 hypothetical protein NMQ04_17885 [Rhodococcus gordoniae]
MGVCAHGCRESVSMASMEPFLPIKHTGSNEIDAADPGPGAPGSDPGPMPSGEQVDPEMAEREKEEFEKRMSEKRREKPVFRAPEVHPDSSGR